MNIFTTITSYLDNDRLTDMLIEAVNIYSPSYAESPIIRYFRRILEQYHIPYLLQPVPSTLSDNERANILIQLGPEPIELILVGHLDTVDLGTGTDQGAYIESDRLYGLGSTDMKGGCCALIESLIALTQAGFQFQKGCLIALVVGEEEYGDGAEMLLEHYTAPVTVVGEPTNLLPCTSHYGYLEYSLLSRGVAAHAALPEQGVNAILANLAWIMDILEASRTLPDAENLAINPRQIQGGEPKFILAKDCEATLDIHIPPSIQADDLALVIEHTKKATMNQYEGIELYSELLFGMEGFAQDSTCKEYQRLQYLFETRGFHWEPSHFRSHSDANLFYQQGSFTLVCGPGNLSVAHRSDEHVSLMEVFQAAHLYAAMLVEWCG